MTGIWVPTNSACPVTFALTQTRVKGCSNCLSYGPAPQGLEEACLARPGQKALLAELGMQQNHAIALLADRLYGAQPSSPADTRIQRTGLQGLPGSHCSERPGQRCRAGQGLGMAGGLHGLYK